MSETREHEGMVMSDGVGIGSVAEVEVENDNQLKEYCRKIENKICEVNCDHEHCHLHPKFKRPGPEDIVI